MDPYFCKYQFLRSRASAEKFPGGDNEKKPENSKKDRKIALRLFMKIQGATAPSADTHDYVVSFCLFSLHEFSAF